MQTRSKPYTSVEISRRTTENTGQNCKHLFRYNPIILATAKIRTGRKADACENSPELQLSPPQTHKVPFAGNGPQRVIVYQLSFLTVCPVLSLSEANESHCLVFMATNKNHFRSIVVVSFSGTVVKPAVFRTAKLMRNTSELLN